MFMNAYKKNYQRSLLTKTLSVSYCRSGRLDAFGNRDLDSVHGGRQSGLSPNAGRQSSLDDAANTPISPWANKGQRKEHCEKTPRKTSNLPA